MKYAIWFLRLLFAAWMIPAGLNHFIPLFPQPLGFQPLSQELINALLDSNMFALVKGVELIAGIGVLFGIYTPLSLLICLPVSFCVFYWDAPLEGWGSIAARYGYAVLLTNLLLCLAYFKSYRSMFTLRVQANRKHLVLVGRILFGGWMLANGANYLFLSLWPAFSGQEPLAIQLMSAFVNSRLIDVAMAMQVVAGALILVGVFVPVALSALMPISSCALFWTVVLNNEPLYMLLAFSAFALNGLLMLAYLPYFHDTLQRHTIAFGEAWDEHLSFDAVYTKLKGSVAREQFVPALIVVLAVIAFLTFVVTGRTAQFCVLTLLYPAFVLLGQRLNDMGYSTWLALVPLALMLTSLSIQLSTISLNGEMQGALLWAALSVFAVFAIWGCTSNSET